MATSPKNELVSSPPVWITYITKQIITTTTNFQFILFRSFCKLQQALAANQQKKNKQTKTKQCLIDDKQENEVKFGLAACKHQTRTLESYRRSVFEISCPTAEADGLICFTAAVFLHKSNNSAFFLSFAAISKLMPLYYKKFFTPHLI